MWVFTPFGFFSVVAHRALPDTLLVRGRVREDLAALADRIGKPRPRVRSTPDADYPFRFELERSRLAGALEAFVLDELTYPNFKGEVAQRQGFARSHAYHAVWDELRRIESPRGAARDCTEPAPFAIGSEAASISSR